MIRRGLQPRLFAFFFSYAADGINDSHLTGPLVPKARESLDSTECTFLRLSRQVLGMTCIAGRFGTDVSPKGLKVLEDELPKDIDDDVEVCIAKSKTNFGTANFVYL